MFDLTAEELLTTTRTVRRRLDFDRAVPRSVIEECLEIALQAPTAANSQAWRWLVVDEPILKDQLAEIYRDNFAVYGRAGNPFERGDDRYRQREQMLSGAQYLAENLHRAPMLLVPCIEAPLDRSTVATGASTWGSILPAVWSFMLAARARGLGSSWTTLHLRDGGEERAGDLLGVPYERFRQAGLFPIAYTVGTDFKRASRQPLSRVLRWNRATDL